MQFRHCSKRNCIVVVFVSSATCVFKHIFKIIFYHAFQWENWKRHQNWINFTQGFQSGPVPGTFTRLRSCIVPAEITEPPKISGGQNHKYDRLVDIFHKKLMITSIAEFSHSNLTTASRPSWWDIPCFKNNNDLRRVKVPGTGPLWNPCS
jgi:hypothetical protein